MDTIRLFLHSNNFRNSLIKNDFNSKTITNIDNNTNSLIETKNNEILIRRNSSSEKLSPDNIKSFLSSHPSSSSLSSGYLLNSSQLETCSGLSIPLSNYTNIVASASASISNARSFTSDNYSTKIRKRKVRRHSWTDQENLYYTLSSPIRRTKSFRYQDRIRKNLIIQKYSTEKIRRRIVEVNRSTKSVSFPLSTNLNNQSFLIASTQIRSVKTTATNAFLTAASIFKYWVHFLELNINKNRKVFFFSHIFAFR